ncbi:MAG: CopG family transcriptional regulator [Acidimicrobiales bacterium]
MRRINITIDEELDDRLEREARRSGTSKSAVIREGLQLILPAEGDPLDALAGAAAGEPVDDIDEVIYEWHS